MVVTIQGLGRLDCKLIAQDEQLCFLTAQERATAPSGIELTEHLMLSYLWVLGAYELLRTLDQRTKAASPSFLHMRERITAAKHLFERVRIPLAKMEASRRHPNDSTIAYPAIDPTHGVAWRIAAGKFVSRRELSDALLSLLTDLRVECG